MNVESYIILHEANSRNKRAMNAFVFELQVKIHGSG